MDPNILHSNDYNPNHVFEDEMQLLRLSIIEDGWTQPIVATPTGEIIDGFHRWTLGRVDAQVRALTGGLVPVVRVDPASRADQQIATIRHNRARGQHGIVAMGDIVRGLLAQGFTTQEVMSRLKMEKEEVMRLSEMRTSPEQAGKDSFGRGWKPIVSTHRKNKRRKIGALEKIRSRSRRSNEGQAPA